MTVFSYLYTLVGYALRAAVQRPLALQGAAAEVTIDVEGEPASKIVQAPVPTRGSPTTLSTITYTRGHTQASNIAIFTNYMDCPIIDQATERRLGYEEDCKCLPVIIACQCLGIEIPKGCKFKGVPIPDKRGQTYWCATQLHLSKEAVVAELEAAEAKTGIPHQLLREAFLGNTFTHGTKTFDGNEAEWKQLRTTASFVSAASHAAADKLWKERDTVGLATGLPPAVPAAAAPGGAAVPTAASVTPRKPYGLSASQLAILDDYKKRSSKKLKK